MWLTIPVKREFPVKINQVEIAVQEWQRKHWLSINVNYSKTPFWSKHLKFFEDLYKKEFTRLVEVNLPIIEWIAEQLNVKRKMILSSQLNLDESLRSTDLLIEIVKKVGGTVYLSGISGRKYLEEDKFKINGMELRYQEFQHPVYNQAYPDFIKNLSSIDYIFNTGKSL